MIAFNYSLYNNPYLFNLSYVSLANVANNVVYQYSTSLFNLNTAIASKSNSLLVTDKDYSLLPMAVRYISSDSRSYIIERPPFRIPVDYSVSKSYKHRKSVKALANAYVWVPWTISKITLDPSLSNSVQFELYFNDVSINSVSDNLIPCYFPNCSNGSVCMGQDTLNSAGLTTKSSILDIYNFYFNSYFSGWNSDLGIRVEGLEYFKDIKQDLIAAKNAPSTFEKFINTNAWGFNNTETHKNFIYLMSKIDLHTTLGFISHLKNIVAQRNSSIAYRYSLSNIMKHTKSFSLPVDDYINHNSYYYMRQIPSLLESYGHSNTHETFSNTRTNVTIANFSSNVHLTSHIDNPFIISQVYLNHYSKKDDQNSFHTENITLDYSLIEPYIVLKNEVSNVNAN
jgi:hypothetical protein